MGVDVWVTTEHCVLLPGDIVLANYGFDSAKSGGAMQACLHIPAGKDQLNGVIEIDST